MTLSVAPTADDIATVLRAFLLVCVPNGVEVVSGQDNRVPPPSGPDYVVFTPMRRERFSTNTDDSADCVFMASIATGRMNVTAMRTGSGPIVIGNQVFGVGLVGTISITRQLSGIAGGPGLYIVTTAQTVSPAQLISAGEKSMMQATRIVYQVQVFGPAAADNSQIISTAFRDSFATEFFSNMNAAVSPLYADDPKQIPFIDDSGQYEDRWILEAHVQANQVVAVPQQYADSVEVTLINVEAQIPA